MALLPDLEPPSSEKANEINFSQRPVGLWLKKQFTQSGITNYPFRGKLVFFVGKLHETGQATSSFYKEHSQFLPHAAILLLLVIVLVANLTQSARASSLYRDFTTSNPDEELAVVDGVSQFTPLIKDGSKIYDRYLTVQTSADGFASNIAPITSQITLRTEPMPDNSSAETTYLVQNGDTLSEIAMEFSVKTTTLKYVNNLDSVNTIKPGMKLKIPVKGYEISATLIAKKDAETAKKKLALTSRNTIARDQSNRKVSVNSKPGAIKNAYPYGWCTYFVATKRYVPGNWGNARSWLNSARNAGYATGKAPAAGSIMVSAESWLGHVAYVESVNSDGTFTISEMNAKGWGVISSRRVSSDYGKILGFVY